MMHVAKLPPTRAFILNSRAYHLLVLVGNTDVRTFAGARTSAGPIHARS